MKRFLKGILGGIGNIIPGLSGSALLVITGIYGDCINAISNIFKQFKKSVIYLFPVGLGIALGTFIVSFLLEETLDKFPLATSIVFIGFMIGTIPLLFKSATKEGFKAKYLISFVIALAIGILLLFLKPEAPNTVQNVSFLKLLISGLILACSTIIPGISATVLLTIFGVYGVYLEAIKTLNIKIIIPILIGFAIAAFLLSKLINLLLKKFYGYTYFAIIGFTIATIPALFFTKITFSLEFFIGLGIAIFAFLLTLFISNKAEK